MRPFTARMIKWQYNEGEIIVIKSFLNKAQIKGMIKSKNEDMFWPHHMRIDGISPKLSKKLTAVKFINEIKHNAYPI